MVKFIGILLIGAGLSACSSYSHKVFNAQRIDVKTPVEKDPEIDSLVAPYRRELALEMNRIIGEATADMQVARPNSTLGQWVTDVVLQFGKDSLLTNQTEKLPVIAILNTGGIRASLSKGSLTVGDIYKLMPFDNQLIALKLPVDQIAEIEAYLQKTGGEPIAGFTVVNGKIVVDNLTESRYLWVITTDFLANGGDKMLFFQAATEKILSPVLLRDLLLREVERTGTIEELLEERIRF
ncbi:MAG: 5'-nucleotidase C-terminal domain-containing protein [Bacteroidota bacterium]